MDFHYPLFLVPLPQAGEGGAKRRERERFNRTVLRIDTKNFGTPCDPASVKMRHTLPAKAKLVLHLGSVRVAALQRAMTCLVPRFIKEG